MTRSIEKNTTEKTFKQNPLPTFFGVFMACFVFIVISIAFGFHLLTIPLAIACGIKFKQAVGKRIKHSHWESLSTEEHNRKCGDPFRRDDTRIPSTNVPFFYTRNKEEVGSIYWSPPWDR